MKKRCYKCKKEKDLIKFSIDRRNKKTGRSGKCKACDKAYLDANKDWIYAKARENYKKNPEDAKQRVYDWREKKFGHIKIERERKKQEKEKLRLEKKEFRKYKRHYLDPISSRIRVYMWASFQRDRYGVAEKFPNIIGCSFEDLKNHIEKQFLKGMNWDNKGEWELDHIIPLGKSRTVEELKELCHHTNVQPLWKVDHKKKNRTVYPLTNLHFMRTHL